jgi:hypothetical protein
LPDGVIVLRGVIDRRLYRTPRALVAVGVCPGTVLIKMGSVECGMWLNLFFVLECNLGHWVVVVVEDVV